MERANSNDCNIHLQFPLLWRVSGSPHINPDGIKGGIVAVTAKIGMGVYIHKTAEAGNYAIIGNYVRIGVKAIIGDYARIGNKANIGNAAIIGNDARIGNDAYIGDAARIGNKARIGHAASIGDYAIIHVDDWWQTVGPQGGRRQVLTVVHSHKLGLRWWVGCRHACTTEELREAVAFDHGESAHGDDYRWAIDNILRHPALVRRIKEEHPNDGQRVGHLSKRASGP